jgi:hypothetical protein
MLRTRNTDAIDNRVLTPKPRVGPPSPELMENSVVFPPRAPAAAGTPLPSASAPPAGGGLR